MRNKHGVTHNLSLGAAALRSDDLGRANSQDFLGSGVPTVRNRSGGNGTHGRYFVCYMHELCSRPHPYRLFQERKSVHPNHVLLNTNPPSPVLRRRPKAVRGRKSATEGSGGLWERAEGICSRKSTREASRELWGRGSLGNRWLQA